MNMIPQGYVMINNKVMPETYRDRYNRITLTIEAREQNAMNDDTTEQYRNIRHEIMQSAMMAA